MKTITENLSVRMRTVPPPKPDSPEIDTILDGIDLLGEIAGKLRLQRWQGLSQTIEQAQAQAPTSGPKPRPDPFGPKQRDFMADRTATIANMIIKMHAEEHPALKINQLKGKKYHTGGIVHLPTRPAPAQSNAASGANVVDPLCMAKERSLSRIR